MGAGFAASAPARARCGLLCECVCGALLECDAACLWIERTCFTFPSHFCRPRSRGVHAAVLACVVWWLCAWGGGGGDRGGAQAATAHARTHAMDAFAIEDAEALRELREHLRLPEGAPLPKVDPEVAKYLKLTALPEDAGLFRAKEYSEKYDKAVLAERAQALDARVAEFEAAKKAELLKRAQSNEAHTHTHTRL